MIACVNPALANVSETLSTLRYAHRAKAIVNEVTVNESSKDDIIHNLREENARLMVLLSSQQEQGLVGQEQRRLEMVVMQSKEMVAQNEALEANRVELEARHEDVVAQNEDLEAQNEELVAQNGDLESHNGELEVQNGGLQAQNAALEAQNEAWGITNEAIEAQNAAWGAEVEGLRQVIREKELATQKETAMLQSALVEERRLTAHHKETIVVMHEMTVETAARVGDRAGELLEAVTSANEKVSGASHMQLPGHDNRHSLTPQH
jgi:kinesin family protein 3/17